MTPAGFAKALRILRAAADLSQADLAARTGISRDQVARLELGRVKRIPGPVLDALRRELPLLGDVIRRGMERGGRV